MIATGLKLDTAVEVHRISTRGYLRASIRLVADDADAGVVEIRRAYGQGGPVLPYATAKTVALNGETIVDIIADDCPELAIVVTTPGAGTFDVEITLDLPCEDAFAAIELDELHTAASWPLSIVPERDRKMTIVAAPIDAVTTAALELREGIDREGQAISTGRTITLDGQPNTFELSARSHVEIYCTAGQDDLSAVAWIYRTTIPETMGVLPDNLAKLDQAQEFTAAQEFANFNIAGVAGAFGIVGRTRITSLATAGESVELPGLSGGLPVITDLVPAAGEFLVRQGDGGYASRALASADLPSAYAGSSFPASPVDGQPFYRTDLDMPELFHWDAGRNKWLGELRIWGFGRANATSSGQLNLRFGEVEASSIRGLLTPSPLTIVGVELFSRFSFTGDITMYEDSTNLGTLLSISSSQSGSSHSLNFDLDADAGAPHKWPLIENISAGTCSNPILLIYTRRRES